MSDRLHALARASLASHRAALDALERDLVPAIVDLAARIDGALRSGGAVLAFGNGGSAADAQHFTAELVGRYALERGPLPAVALTTDTSALTAIGNDYGFEEIFARQVRAVARPGDVAVGLSTSGRSPNVLRGLAEARERGALAVGLTGAAASPLAGVCDVVLAVPSTTTARIQEGHIVILHLLCELLDAARADDRR